MILNTISKGRVSKRCKYRYRYRYRTIPTIPIGFKSKDLREKKGKSISWKKNVNGSKSMGAPAG